VGTILRKPVGVLLALGVAAGVGLAVTEKLSEPVVIEVRWGGSLLGLDQVGKLPVMTVAWSSGGGLHSEILNGDKATGWFQKTVPIEAPDGTAAIVVVHAEPAQKVPTSCRIQSKGTWHPGQLNKHGGATCTAKA
jgi:hypothetical protein